MTGARWVGEGTPPYSADIGCVMRRAQGVSAISQRAPLGVMKRLVTCPHGSVLVG